MNVLGKRYIKGLFGKARTFYAFYYTYCYTILNNIADQSLMQSDAKEGSNKGLDLGLCYEYHTTTCFNLSFNFISEIKIANFM